jgi:hypothetical protein
LGVLESNSKLSRTLVSPFGWFIGLNPQRFLFLCEPRALVGSTFRSQLRLDMVDPLAIF